MSRLMNSLFNMFQKGRKIIMMALVMIILFSLSINTALPITIDQTPEYDLREGSMGYVYPLLDGFYAVEDWEVAVCLNKKYKEQLEQEETRNAINDMMVSDYGGLVATVTAKVEIGVTDEKDPSKVTNRYTVCYGVLPTGEDDLTVDVYLAKGITGVSKPVSLKESAPAGVGAGACKVVLDKDVYCKIKLKLTDLKPFIYPIIAEDIDGNEIPCDGS